MTNLTLGVLGPFQASLADQPLTEFRTNKVRALLIYLAIEERPVTREALMALLWPGLPERSARANLRQIAYYLRKDIPEVAAESGEKAPVDLLVANRQTIGLNPGAAVSVDAAQFEAHLASTQAHEHLDLFSCHDCRQELESAVALYRGNFLEDFYLDDSNEFEDWAQTRREAYRRQALDALEVLTTIAIRQKDYGQARAHVERQLEIDNLREAAYRQLMEVLALGGQRNEALAVYENCRRLLADELGMAPTKRTTELYEKILAGDLTFESSIAEGVRGYELKDEIGAGAYGAIHRAVQPSVGREVAVKVIRRRYANDPEFIRRFEAEAQTVARLEHPYIVPLYDYWRDPDGAYLVMRYLRGGNLLSALEAGPWDMEPAGTLLDQIAGALSAAHGQGVVHRDIKPANILLDETGNAYLSDFGIAKDLTGEMQMTAEGAVIGTPDYISPEQILNDPITAQSDIYSLGAVLYETLTGEKPFPDSSVANLIYKHLNEAVPLVSASRPDLPPQVDLVIQKATAKQPADRYASALEMASAFKLALSGAAVVEAALPAMLPSVTEVTNPYKGLRAFQEADAEDFFGREVLVDQLIGRLADSRFVAVVGPSGSGKSSAVKAGLIPALRAKAIPGSEKWFVAEMAPGTHPLEELELALWPVAVDPPPSLVAPMERDTRGLLRTIRRILPDEPDAQLLLVIDQFEELFTLVDDEERRDFFVDSLLTALRAPRCPLRVVITLRADFYDRPLQYESLGRLIKDNTEIVLPLSAEELSWAVRQPARRMGVGLESGLAEVIMADVAEQPGALPLLQYALTELFERRQNGRMSREAYEDIGGVLGALGRRAEEIYTDLDESGRESARQLFLRLVTLGEGVEDTRRRVLRSEVEAISDEQLTINNQLLTVNDPRSPIPGVIDAFGTGRLLTFDHDPLTRGPTVEVAHEALLREWGRLRGWLDESRYDVRLQRALAVAAAEWGESGQAPGFLLRDARLDQFAGWAATSSVALTGDENAYLLTSITARESRLAEEEARRQRELETAQKLAETEHARAEEQTQAAARLRRRAVLLTGALVVAGILAIAAFFFANQSSANAAEAQGNADLAATREVEALANADLAVAREAEAQAEADQRATAEADALAAQAVAENEAEQRAAAESIAIEERQEALRQASIGLASQAELQRIGSQPERAVLLGLEAVENYPYTWQAERALGQAVLNHRLLVELDHESYVNFVNVSPDETRIVTGADDGTAKVWDAVTGELIHTLSGHENWVFRAFWSPAGDRIVTASMDDTARVWDAETGEELFVLKPGGAYAFWSPDGSKIVTSRQPDDVVTIWDAATGETLLTISGHEGRTLAIDSWSPNGDRVATGGRDRMAKVWDATTGEEIVTLSGHEGTVLLTFFSPDGSKIVTSSFDGTAKVWDAGTGEELHTFSGHEGLPAAKWSPSGDRIITFSRGLLRVWDAESGEELLLLSAPLGSFASWSPDGTLVAAGGADGQVKVWDSVTGRELLDIVGHDGWIGDLGWAPSGAAFWTSAGDAAKVWKVSNKIFDVSPSDQASEWASEPAWSPSGEEVARGYTGAVKIWDVSTESEILNLPFEPTGEGNRSGAVFTLAWSPIIDRILSGDADGFLRVWDTKNGDELLTLPAHENWIWTAAWSPDGGRFVSASEDGSAKVWGAESGRLLLTFDEHSPVSASWSPDGNKIVTASLEGSAKIWDADTGEVLIDLFPENFTSGVSTAAWSPDGTRIATFSQDRVGRIWDADSGKQLLSFNGVSGEPKAFWSPSGTHIVTGGLNGVQVWDASTGNQLLSLSDSFVYSKWSPDGTRIALGDIVGTLEVFPIWRSLEELVDLAKDCCVIGTLTAEERAEFGLPAQ